MYNFCVHMHTHSQRDINKKKQDYLHVYTLIEPKGFKRSAPTAPTKLYKYHKIYCMVSRHHQC